MPHRFGGYGVARIRAPREILHRISDLNSVYESSCIRLSLIYTGLSEGNPCGGQYSEGDEWHRHFKLLFNAALNVGFRCDWSLPSEVRSYFEHDANGWAAAAAITSAKMDFMLIVHVNPICTRTHKHWLAPIIVRIPFDSDLFGEYVPRIPEVQLERFRPAKQPKFKFHIEDRREICPLHPQLHLPPVSVCARY